MKALILFNLKRRFLNHLSLLVNLLVILSITFLFQADRIMTIEEPFKTVYLDASCAPYAEYFETLALNQQYEPLSQQTQKDVVRVSYHQHFVVEGKLDQTEETLLRQDLQKVIRRHYLQTHGFMSEYLQQLEQIEVIQVDSDEQSNGLWIIETVLYFLLLNYSGMLSNEVIYEKSSHVLDLILTNVSAREHLLSKIWIGYLTPLIQFILTGATVLINYLIRMHQDGMAGLAAFSNQLLGQTDPLENVPKDPAVIITVMGLLISGLLIIQVLMLVLTSRLSNGEQVSALQGLWYVLMLIVYYLSMTYGKPEMLDKAAIKILSYGPVSSMLIMSARLLMNKAVITEGMIAAVINVATLIGLIKLLEGLYQRNILTYHNN